MNADDTRFQNHLLILHAPGLRFYPIQLDPRRSRDFEVLIIALDHGSDLLVHEFIFFGLFLISMMNVYSCLSLFGSHKQSNAEPGGRQFCPSSSRICYNALEGHSTRRIMHTAAGKLHWLIMLCVSCCCLSMRRTPRLP